MGRHSRRGPAPKGDHADTAAVREGRPGGTGRRRLPGPGAPEATGEPGAPQQGAAPGAPMPGGPTSYGEAPYGAMPGGFPGGTPAQGVPRVFGGAAPQGAPRGPGGASAQGAGFPGGTPARGVPRLPDGTPARGVPRLPDGTPAHGSPRVGGGAPMQGGPGFPGGTPARGVPRVRGGHPEQREPGGGWGEFPGRTGSAYGTSPGAVAGVPAAPGRPGPGTDAPGVPLPRQRQAHRNGPRPDLADAFGEEDDDVFARPARRAPAAAQASDPYGSVTGQNSAGGPGGPESGADHAPPTGEPAPAKGGKGRTFTGIAAAAVTTVLAVVVAGQVTDGQGGGSARGQAAADQARDARDPASRTDDRPTPSPSGAAAPLTYEQKMARTYPLDAAFKGSGEFEAIPGVAKAPGTGQKYTYRVDIEQGLGLDGELFAEAVQKTLNDNRSWAHNGARTFERIHTGQPDFVITLASPGTTATWCAKSGLDTTVDNVSCDSAATERVMINAYRWAQGAEPFGDQIHAYRQMLINHEVGHRIGYNHVTCDKDGELAPVMQQQTKFVDHDGIDCRPNAWAYPNG
ncbi:DUF3152 domain-containing protein [Streptomyces sp. NPDC018947]|uniref:DUF3152 domain-containing protein n=1 Tax=Streptomyces sp. NPDC018947 TaxID=3365054 RepID=UPI0037879FB1